MTDFDRDIYCLAGLPFDAVDMDETVDAVQQAKVDNEKCFMSTPNMNFIANAVGDPEFLKSVIHSDLVVADGTPIVWMAKLLGIPITQRVAGSSLFELLHKGQGKDKKMKVYFMGGLDGVAKSAEQELNKRGSALTCVGHYNPGFGTIEDMSTDNVIKSINDSGADFLVLALGAKKGQAWILQNREKIKVPVMSHLGAVINFEARRLQRAPQFVQNTGFEWLWRIKEEPALWRRYFADGLFFSKLLATKMLPMALWLKLNRSRLLELKSQSDVSIVKAENSVTLKVKGVIMDEVEPKVRDLFKEACKYDSDFSIDLSEAEYVGFGFLGLVLMMKKKLDAKGLNTSIVNCNAQISKVINWNSLNYLKN